MTDNTKSETAPVAPGTASEFHDPGYHVGAEESADTVANPPPEGKDDDAIESPVNGDDAEQGDVAVEQGSNPVPATGGDLADACDDTTPEFHDDIESADVTVSQSSNPIVGGSSQPRPALAGEISVPPTKKKRGPKPKAVRTPFTVPAPEYGMSAPENNAAPFATPVEPVPVQTALPADQALGSSNMRWVPAANVITDPLFSTLFPIDEETLEAIAADMRAKGFDPAHSLQVWDYQGKLILVDGYTRRKAAEKAKITLLPIYVHQFADREEAFTFAVKAQTVRRNMHDGDRLNLVQLFDEKVVPGMNQPRAGDGHFDRKASSDAHGKSATRTGDMLGISTTKVERIRRVLKKADAATKQAVLDNEITINAALQRIKPASGTNKGSKTSTIGSSTHKSAAEEKAVEDSPVMDQGAQNAGATTSQNDTAIPDNKADAGSANNGSDLLTVGPVVSATGSGANTHRAPDTADEILEAHTKAIEAADTAETFLRNAQGKTLTEQQRREWKQVIGHIDRVHEEQKRPSPGRFQPHVVQARNQHPRKEADEKEQKQGHPACCQDDTRRIHELTGNEGTDGKANLADQIGKACDAIQATSVGVLVNGVHGLVGLI